MCLLWSTRHWIISTNWVINKFNNHSVIRCIHKIVKRDSYLNHVCQLGMAELQFASFHEITFCKICWENSSFIKVTQEQRELYVNTKIYFWSYLYQFLEWEIFHTRVVKKTKTYLIFSKIFSSLKLYHRWDNFNWSQKIFWLICWILVT